MASLNRVGYGLTVAAHVPPNTFQVGEARFLTVRTPFGERVCTASALGRVRRTAVCQRTAGLPYGWTGDLLGGEAHLLVRGQLVSLRWLGQRHHSSSGGCLT